MSGRLRYLISKREAGITLLAYLQRKLKSSNRAIKRALEKGACRHNGVIERFGSIRLNRGDQITFAKEPLKKKEPTLTLPILFEDDYLILCNKPEGLVSDASLFSTLLNLPIFLVHRLDKETSGVIAVAKKKEVQKKLEKLFYKREVTKTYLALVVGKTKRKEGVIDHFLAKKKSYQGQALWGKSSKGMRAITHFRTLSSKRGYSLLQCVPKTGRTHQLRVHLSEMGNPIVGDVHYGREESAHVEGARLFLHAYSLAFVHPIKEEELLVISPLPKAFHSFF